MLMKTPDKVLAADLLNRAAQIIEERGWCQSELESLGRVCMIGALAVAEFGYAQAGINKDCEFILGPLSSTGAKAMKFKEVDDVWRWNDSVENVGEVLNRLRTGAIALRQST